VAITEEIRARFPKDAEDCEYFESMLSHADRELQRCRIELLNPYPRVQVGLGAKGMKSWRAIVGSFFSGFEEDAEIVLRSLVDVVVDLKFIALDPEERAARFIDYQVIHRLRWYREGVKRLKLDEPEKDPRLVKFLQDIASERDEVLRRRPKWATLPSSWTPERMPEKFDAINEPALYLTYMQGCAQTHPNVVALSRYFEIIGGRAKALFGPRFPATSRVIADATHFLVRLVGHLDDQMKLGLEKKFDAVVPRLEAMLKRSREDLRDQKAN